MIAVLKTEKGIAPLDGNPTLLSLDGETRAPLLTVLAESWTDDERAKFGVFLVEPMVIPEGKQVVGTPRYEEDGQFGVIQVCELEDIPPASEIPPSALDLMRTDLEALARRVADVEAKVAGNSQPAKAG